MRVIGNLIQKRANDILTILRVGSIFQVSLAKNEDNHSSKEKKNCNGLSEKIPCRRCGAYPRFAASFARIVFDFRPIKVDSAHRPVFRGADTPGGRLSAGWIRTFSSRGKSAISRTRSLLRPVLPLSFSSRERAPLATPRNII